MKSCLNGLVYACTMGVALMVVVGVVRTGGCVPAQRPDAMYEDLAVINARWNADWDMRRGDAKNDDELKEMRKEWRAGYEEDVRACYIKHGRKVPKHLVKEPTTP